MKSLLLFLAVALSLVLGSTKQDACHVAFVRLEPCFGADWGAAQQTSRTQPVLIVIDDLATALLAADDLKKMVDPGDLDDRVGNPAAARLPCLPKMGHRAEMTVVAQDSTHFWQGLQVVLEVSKPGQEFGIDQPPLASVALRRLSILGHFEVDEQEMSSEELSVDPVRVAAKLGV